MTNLTLLSKNAFNSVVKSLRELDPRIDNAVFFTVSKLQDDNNTQPMNALLKACTTEKGNLNALGQELKKFFDSLDLPISWEKDKDFSRFAFNGKLEKSSYTLESFPLFSNFTDKKAAAKALIAAEKASEKEAKEEEKKALELKALDLKLEAEKATSKKEKEALEAEKASTLEALESLESADFNKAATAKSLLKLVKQVKYSGVKGSINELEELSNLLHELQEGTIQALNKAKKEAQEATDSQRVEELSNLKGSSKSKSAGKKVDTSASAVTSVEVEAINKLKEQESNQALAV